MKLTKKEIYFLIIAILILLVVTNLPILYGYLIRSNDYYNGLHIFSPLDGSVYYSYIQQVKDGKILLDDLFTNESGGLRLFNIFWLIVGLAARIFHLSAPWAYHIFRIILMPIFLLVLYKFVRYLLADYSAFQKKIAFLYAIFATGIGGLTLLLFGNRFFNNNPLDLQVPESSNFLITLYSPHFIASITLIVLIFYFFLLAIDNNKIHHSLAAGFFALVLFNFHPFYVPVVYVIPAVYLAVLFLINKKVEVKKIGHYLILVVMSAPSVIYYAYLLYTSPALQIKAAQNNCLTPGGMIFFVSYGLGLIMAIGACVYLVDRRKIDHKKLFLIIWFWLGIFFIYSPFNFQRRLTEGFVIPLSLLAFMALAIVYDFLKEGWPFVKKIKFWQALPLLVLLFCFSNPLVYSWDFKYLKLKPPVIFINQDIKQALEWYRTQTNLEQTLLTSRIIGNIVPGLVGRRVFLGHDVETVNYDNKINQLNWFFGTNNDDLLKKEFLKQNNINYLFYSSQERQMGLFQPDKKDYLREGYNQNGIKIYKVKAD